MQDIQVLIITFVNLFLQYVWMANLFFIIVIISEFYLTIHFNNLFSIFQIYKYHQIQLIYLLR